MQYLCSSFCIVTDTKDNICLLRSVFEFQINFPGKADLEDYMHKHLLLQVEMEACLFSSQHGKKALGREGERTGETTFRECQRSVPGSY